MTSENVVIKPIDFPNIGAVTCKVPTSVLAQIKAEVDAIASGDKTPKRANKSLVGLMEREYYLEDCFPAVEEFVLWLLKTYGKYYNYADTIKVLNASLPYRLGELWVNFQRKHEANPIHDHSGVMSFVIWLKIPFNLDDEDALYPEVNGHNRSARFEFLYSDILGRPCSVALDTDTSYEGAICMFPAPLGHAVNAFHTSDEYRISVSGNIVLDAT